MPCVDPFEIIVSLESGWCKVSPQHSGRPLIISDLGTSKIYYVKPITVFRNKQPVASAGESTAAVRITVQSFPYTLGLSGLRRIPAD